MNGHETHAARPRLLEAPAPDGSHVEIGVARTPEEMNAVYRMTHDAYVEMGFIAPRPGGKLVHYPHLDFISETTVLLARLDGAIVGTNSLTLDGPAGLHVDEDFKPEADAIRAEGRALAASYRINTCTEVRHRNAIVMGLIRETVRLALSRGVETCLFIFHKRHERVYRRLLNMKTVAERPEIACVQNFPAVFMRCDFEALPAAFLDMPHRASA